VLRERKKDRQTEPDRESCPARIMESVPNQRKDYTRSHRLKGMHRYARTDFGRRPIQGQEDHGFLCVEEMSEGDRRFSDQ